MNRICDILFLVKASKTVNATSQEMKSDQLTIKKLKMQLYTVKGLAIIAISKLTLYDCFLFLTILYDLPHYIPPCIFFI